MIFGYKIRKSSWWTSKLWPLIVWCRRGLCMGFCFYWWEYLLDLGQGWEYRFWGLLNIMWSFFWSFAHLASSLQPVLIFSIPSIFEGDPSDKFQYSYWFICVSWGFPYSPRTSWKNLLSSYIVAWIRHQKSTESVSNPLIPAQEGVYKAWPGKFINSILGCINWGNREWLGNLLSHLDF